MELFGYELTKKNKENVSFAPKQEDDGAVVVQGGGLYGTYLDLDGSVRSESELVNKYREMAQYPEIDKAIDNIVNETITDEPESETVEIILDDLEQPDRIKKLIVDEFKHTKKLLEFNTHSYEIFKRWYIDGRLYYHSIIDQEQPKNGIQELRYIDPRKIRKVRELKKKKGSNALPDSQTNKEFYIYNEKGFSNAGKAAINPTTAAGVRIAKDSIVHCTSGLTSQNGDLVQSYLHKAIKPLNQLASMENSLIIYRVSRAPERRVFYIDVGNLPKMKAEQYLRDIMNRFKNKVVYNAQTGEVSDQRKHMCYSMNTKIPLLDGRTLELQDIIKEYKAGKKNWVYSCDPVTGKFYPGPVDWAGITKRNAKVVKITFDNGKSVKCTPDHKFPVWNKGFVEAQHLTTEDSIIPGYRRKKSIMKGKAEYEQIYKNETKTWEFTHREVESWKKELGLTEEIICGEASERDPYCKIGKIIKQDNTEDLHDHKILSVEALSDTIDVGSMTIDKNETYHSNHTYLLDAGVYTKNTMLEDFWLPRSAGGRGTEVSTLPGGQNLNQMEDIEYFQNKLYESLNVPITRLNPEAGFNIGRSSEISRDEVQFSKFIDRLRAKFATLFLKVLERQLILKGIITAEDWEDFKEVIRFKFATDNYFAELKETEILRERVNMLTDINDFVGLYYSHEWVRRNVLKQSDEEIEEIDKQIEDENQNEKYNPKPETEPEGEQENEPEEPEEKTPTVVNNFKIDGKSVEQK